MGRPKSVKPKHCHHKTSGRGYVTLDGKTTYTGKWGTQAAQDVYDRLIGQWIANGRQTLPESQPGAASDTTIADVIAAFWMHAQEYYKGPDGQPGGELVNYRCALKPLVRLYGETRAEDFGPLALKTVRAQMIQMNWCRTYVNRQVARLKQVFRWAAENEVIPAGIFHAVNTVQGLRRGKGGARESEPVMPVAVADVEAIAPYLSRPLAAMARLQILTGARSGELCIMRTCDIDRGGPVWHYTPSSHKTAHHGHARTIPIGPKAQAILEPLLKTELSAFVFSPADAEADRHEKQRQRRKSKVTPSQQRRGELANRPTRKRPPKDRYCSNSYRHAVQRACEKAFGCPRELLNPPKIETQEQRTARLQKLAKWRRDHTWHPHQARHTAATIARREAGIEAANVLMGHKTGSMTEIYAVADRQKLDELMARIG